MLHESTSRPPPIPPRTSVRTPERRRKSLPARTLATAPKQRSGNRVNVRPASNEVISSLIETLEIISSPAEHHFEKSPTIAASYSTPTSPRTWQAGYHFPLVFPDGYAYKSDPANSTQLPFESELSSYPSQDGSLFDLDDAASMGDVPRRQSPNYPQEKVFRASSTAGEELHGDALSIGKLSIEPGNRHSSVSIASGASRNLKGWPSLKDLRLKMSKDRMREDRSRLYVGEDSRTARTPSPSPLRMRLSGSPTGSESAAGFSNNPSPIHIPKRTSSARHTSVTPELDSKSLASDASPSSVSSPRRVPLRDSSLRHSFSVSPAQSKRNSDRGSRRESLHARKSSYELQSEVPGQELAQVLDELAEDDVSRRIKELKDQKRLREHELMVATPHLPETERAPATRLDTLRLQLSSETLENPKQDELSMLSSAPTSPPIEVDAEASAPPPQISQRVERNGSPRLSSLLNRPPQEHPAYRRPLDVPRMHSSPPQRSNSKLFRRLSRPTSPTIAAKHRRTYSGGVLQPRSPVEDEPTSADPIDEAVHTYLSSSRFSQKVCDPLTGRVISFSDVGDPAGSVVICCVGMGLTRYIMAFYDELAVTLKLRLITPDRPGVGSSEPHPEGSDTPLGWPDDVRAICAHLKINKFSILAHSAGAIYALATALRMPQHIRGRIHLLAPWIPPSQMSAIGTQQEALPASALPYSQRFLRSLPTTFLKAANSSWLSATSASVTTSLPKSPRQSKRKGKGAGTPEPSGSSRNDSLSPQSPHLNDHNAKPVPLDRENICLENPAVRPPLTNSATSRLAEKERLHNYDTRLSEGIWEHATTCANPAVDLLVCLERRQPIGFRYVDITKSIVIHHGSKDSRVPVENVKWLAKTMRKCEVRVLPGEGHGLMASAGVMGNVLMDMAKEWEDWNRITRGRAGMERRATAGI
ncbi:MAG: hypothetical protein Q9191_000682 [Dirinaria sp. TL-2023a]